jgi:hypothetical protein
MLKSIGQVTFSASWVAITLLRVESGCAAEIAVFDGVVPISAQGIVRQVLRCCEMQSQIAGL